MDYSIEQLIEILKKHAVAFLNDADEFYPFGVGIGRERDIKSIGVYLENDYPESEEVLAVLERAIDKNLSNGEFMIAAIALDVYLSTANEKTSAVEVRIFTSENKIEKLHIPYQKENGKYVLGTIK